MDEKPKNDHVSTDQIYELAGLIDRLAANIIDSFLILIPLMIVGVISSTPGQPVPRQIVQFVFMAVPVAYHWYFWTRREGQTPGKFALGIRVVKADGSKIGDIDAVMRAIGYHVSAMLFGLGFIWALLDKNNQSWHDKIARTYVIRSNGQRKTVEISA